MYKDLTIYRRQCLTAAKDLGYPKEVITQLKEAKNEAELCRIMSTARKELL